jgi:hypothetical protein
MRAPTPTSRLTGTTPIAQGIDAMADGRVRRWKVIARFQKQCKSSIYKNIHSTLQDDDSFTK